MRGRSFCDLFVAIGLVFVFGTAIGYPGDTYWSSPTPFATTQSTPQMIPTPAPTQPLAAIQQAPAPTPATGTTTHHLLEQYSKERCDDDVADLWEECAEKRQNAYNECLAACPNVLGHSLCVSRCKRVYRLDREACFLRECTYANLDEHCKEAYGEEAHYLCGGVNRGDSGD